MFEEKETMPRLSCSILASMEARTLLIVTSLALACLSVPPVWGQLQIPNQQTQTLVVDIASVKDKVIMYVGDPAFFLELSIRPGTVMPRTEFVNPAQSAVLRIRDQTLFDDAPPPEEVYIDGELVEDEYQPPRPASQSWEIKISPASPGKYVLRAIEGQATYDFTDMPVREAYIEGDSTKLQVEFTRPNLIELERLKITSTGGTLRFIEFLNARAMLATFTTTRTDCEIEITGKPYRGEPEVHFEGMPKKMKLIISKKIGLRLVGPAGIIGRFDRKDMELDGLNMVTKDFSEKECRMTLFFAQRIPEIKVEWN